MQTDGKCDFIITHNGLRKKEFYIELKSIYTGKDEVKMHFSQAEAAVNNLNSFFLCVVENLGNINLDEDQIKESDLEAFKQNAIFNNSLGAELKPHFNAINLFTKPSENVEVNLSEGYQFTIKRKGWGNLSYNDFIETIMSLV